MGKYEKKVAGFEITVNDVGRMHEKDAPKDLIDKILNMVVAEILPGIDNPVQVSLHKVSYDVNIGIVGLGLWLEDVQQPDDVIMLKKF